MNYSDINIPWIVFADKSALREEPKAASPIIVELQRLDEMVGTRIVTSKDDREWVETEKGGFLSLNDLHRVHPSNVREGNLPIGSEVVDRLLGLPLDYTPNDLVPMPAEITIVDGKEYLLREEAANHASAMIAAAEADGVPLRIVSAFRSGMYQKTLFERAIERSGPAQRYSARPGHSEHQLGTAIDITDPKEKFSFQHAFQNTPQCRWLTENAAKFGFRRSYTDDNINQTGYISEPWHWRYIGTV